MSHISFATTTRGLDRNLPPMRLYEKAKRLGIWNPSDIDFSKDKVDWSTLKDDEKDLILKPNLFCELVRQLRLYWAKCYTERR